jgi:hypothetical protein
MIDINLPRRISFLARIIGLVHGCERCKRWTGNLFSEYGHEEGSSKEDMRVVFPDNPYARPKMPCVIQCRASAGI